MKKISCFLLLALCCLLLPSGKTVDPALQYISRFSQTAVDEMYRSGIPASITLAQGMLESGYGKSDLAVQSNNHFGIKCHNDWKGERVYHDDDQKGECFRKYANPEESYRDHSDFLRYKSRYASLFELDIRDYKSWAHGLKAAGYATAPTYATALITLIEKYGLAKFDVPDTARAAVSLPDSPLSLEAPVRAVKDAGTGIFAVTLSREMLSLNGVPFIYAREGETFRSIAHSYDLFPSELASFNEDRDADRPLLAGEMVFLSRKASRSAKGLDKYVCEGGETLKDISQKYAVRLSRLKKLNKDVGDPSAALPEDCVIMLSSEKKTVTQVGSPSQNRLSNE